MKKQDTIKIVIAVVCLLAAVGIFFALNFGGGNSGGGQTIGTSATGEGATGERLSEEEVRDLADEEGATFGGNAGPVKPTPRRR